MRDLGNVTYRIKIIALALVTAVSITTLTGCGCVSMLLSVLDDGEYEIESDAPASASTFSDDRYAYNTLDETGKVVYDELLTGIVNMRDTIMVSTDDEDLLTRVVECIAADHGELFYVDGYAYSYSFGSIFGVGGFDVSPNYTMTRAERDDYQNRIDAVANEWLAEISLDASDYAKSKWVYETLINRVDYVADAPNNQNIISVFLNRQTVCQGYSSAANYLLTKLGIQSMIVPGDAEGGPHAWNCVRLDGEYYLMDITWGNTSYTNETSDKHISYIPFNTTTAELSRTHTVDAVFPVPECTSINDNYYYQEGCYFDSFRPEKMGMIIHNGYVRGEDVSIKCADIDTYKKMKKYFIDDTHFTDYCNGARSLQYTEFADDRVMEFHFN